MDSTQKAIERLDRYLTLTRYKYTAQEKLSRLQILEDYYVTEKTRPSNEMVSIKIESAESLSKTLVLPLKVRGVFLTEGMPKARYYSKEALKESANNPINARFPIMLDHADKEVSKIVGVVDKIEYDDSIRGLRWWGHINDETFARNIIDGIITDVSVTVFSGKLVNSDKGPSASMLTFKELSLVQDGADPNNTIEPVFD